MPLKSNRRKNKSPRRLAPQEEWPSDPLELAHFISQRALWDFYETPTLPSIYYDEVNDVRNGIKSEESDVYRCRACHIKTYKSFGGLKYHIMQTCDQVPREYYKCLLCDFQDHEQRAIEYHIQETHVEKFITPQPEEKAQRRASKLGRLKVLMYEESSSAADVIDKEMGSDYDLSMEDDEEIPVKTKSTPKSKSSKRSPRTPASDRKQSRTTYTALCKPLSAAFEWAYLRRRDLEKRYPLLYPEWTPTNTLGETETGDVIKKCKLRNISPSFAVDSTTLNKTSAPKKPQTEKLDFQKLICFESVATDEIPSSTFYTGGAVWSMAWCPYPSSVDYNQYLALSTVQSEHYLDPAFKYNDLTLVQIWDCGKLPLKLEKDETIDPPKFSFGLTMEGPIWDMKWCPYGGYTSSRIGLLAVASANGDAYIFSIPTPKSELKSSESNIFSANPLTRLCPVRGEKRPFGQTFSLSWSIEGGCGIIAAGFASGHVAVWDLKSTSKLLVEQNNDGTSTIIYACHTFRAHHKPARGIVFCPFDSDIIVTGGNDRFLKLWNRKKTNSPLHETNVTKCSMTTEIDWPLIYNGIYTATNNAFSIPYFHSCLYVKLNVPSDTVPPVINVFPNKSASWTVTSSDWLNSVASGDVTGSALIYASNNWNRGNIYIKKMPRMVLSQCDIVEDQVDGDENVDNVNKEQGLKLVFRDANTNTDLNGVEKLESYRRARTYEGFKEDVFKPHDSGILKMRWNPNLSSYTCIATATNSGLVRLSRVEGMISHDLEVTQQRIIGQDV